MNKVTKEYSVDRIIHESGHQVLRLPPYHCQFNPIELIWGICKNYFDKHIGRDGYGDECVLNMWKEAINQVNPEIWYKSIKHTENIINDWCMVTRNSNRRCESINN
jgi:transposase